MGYFNFSKSNLPIQLAQAGVYDSAAGTGHNLSGFAWSSNIGWISFNSTDCDNNGSIYLGTPAGCPVNGTVFFDYGVYINNNTGDISGFAWSENVGWISFNRENYCESGVNIGKTCANSGDCDGKICGGDSAGKTGDPLYSPYNSTTGTIAKYNAGTHVIDGWAKILSMGDDGWISFNCSNNGGSCGTSDYKVIANVTNSELEGWAWNGNNDDSGIGWISFNSNNSDSGGGNYKVEAQLNQKPSVDNLVAPQWNQAQACNTTLRANLSWDVHDQDVGDKVSAYQLVLKDASDDSIILDTGKCNCSPTDDGCDSKCTINLNIDFSNGNTMTYTVFSSYLDYDTNYKWKVRIWDDSDEASDWGVYNDNSGSDTDGDLDSNSLTFTTYAHEFPQPYFTWSPAQPAIGEDALFISRDLSKYSTDAQPNTDLDCEFGSCIYTWSDASGLNAIDSANASSTIITINEGVDMEIKLKIDDGDYSCSTSSKFTIENKLPTWIEAR
ncbi:MAG: hypothetical protein J7L15_01300 [Clostridiales bacterium]|nr:hypothetical protein [Clostridiales bacterium]